MAALTCYGIYVYRASIVAEGVDPSTFDVSSRYNATAGTFDRDVDFTERYTGIIKLRKALVQQARGNVLEAAVGTGRNSAFYDFDRVKSLTLLDQSKEMIDVARAKWQDMGAEDRQCRFFTRSALEPLPPAPGSKNTEEDDGFNTILATMSLCSTPVPELFLRNLASGLSYRDSTVNTASAATTNPDENPPARILLLEHGRSYYSWINKLLDRTAPGHALKHGCWWNRDVGQIVQASGLEIIDIQRRDLGTTWWLELGLPDEAKDERRQQWLDETREQIAAMKARLAQKQGVAGKEIQEQDEVRRRNVELEKWRREQRAQMKMEMEK